MLEAENWVALGFLSFFGLLAYLGVHRKLIDAIDHRQARIKSELEHRPSACAKKRKRCSASLSVVRGAPVAPLGCQEPECARAVKREAEEDWGR